MDGQGEREMGELEKARRRVAEAWEEAEGRLEDWGAAQEELHEAERVLAHLEDLERSARAAGLER